jgi:hypothetical protein
MVSVASGPLTRTAFRRDVRLFLSGLVGFLILLILLLLLFLRVDLDRTEKTIDHSEATIADVAAVNATPGSSSSSAPLRCYCTRRWPGYTNEPESATPQRSQKM